MNQALDNFLSLVLPSGRLLFGFDSLKAFNPARVKLIVIMENASSKTRAAALTYARTYNIDHLKLVPTSVPQLIKGKNLAVFSVLDENIASKIIKLVKEGDTYE